MYNKYMDKRQEKSIQTIYESFTSLINKKKYDDITIQDILNEGHISRSTFYAHFKTKDELLLKISGNIFDHVFSHSLKEEKTHDFSSDDILDYKHLITHIFYHLKDEKELISGILSSSASILFLDGFKKHLNKFMDAYLNNYPYDKQIPIKLLKIMMVNNFISIIQYWKENKFKDTPEELTEYFIDTFKKVI